MEKSKILVLLFLLVKTLTYGQSDVVFTFSFDRHDSVSIEFQRDNVFNESGLGGVYQVVNVQDRPVTVRYADVNAPARLTLGSYGWPGHFFANDWIVEPGDSIHIYISFNNSPNPFITFQGNGATKYQLAFSTRHLSDKFKGLEFEIYDKIKTHDQARKDAVELEREYLSKVRLAKHSIAPAVYKIWVTDIKSQANLAKLRILSDQWTSQKELRVFIQKELLNRQDETEPALLYTSRALVDYQSEITKWKLLQQYDPEYKPFDLGYIKQYTLKNLFDEFQKLPAAIREVLMVYTLGNHSTLAFVFGETHPSILTECLALADQVVTTNSLKIRLKKIKEYIEPGIVIENLRTITESGDSLSLSDLRGRKIILDLWGPGCTACLDFKNDLVEHILPNIKSRKDIIIWSIGGTSEKKLWQRYLPTYSHRDFTSTWLQTPSSGTEWEKKYNISYSPFIMLIDEEGKLISSTVRRPDTILKLFGIAE